jgi:hypothetical protein
VNLAAASRAEAELGAEIVIVKKTSSEYRPGIDPPCPSVVVNGELLVRDGTVTFEQLRDALLQDPEYSI